MVEQRRQADVMWMEEALALAREALESGQFPVGAVLVSGGVVVGRGKRLNASHSAGGELEHAEISALRQWAAAHAGQPPPSDLTLYVTLEPCLMCFGAAVLSGVKRIVYAYEDVMGGACGLDPAAVHSPGHGASGLYQGTRVEGGLLRGESLALFKQFFGEHRGDGYWQGSLLCRYTLEVE